jgi:hypothetical protein
MITVQKELAEARQRFGPNLEFVWRLLPNFEQEQRRKNGSG